jgi:threonine synthase
MWPWEEAPHSIAHGILDDETYDWHAVVTGMLESGGYPLTVSEDRLAQAREFAAHAAGVVADATGAAGLAGLLELSANGLPRPAESVALLFTGGGA